MTYQDILYSIDGPTATITLNRPQVLNAVSLHTIDELVDALDRADSDDRVRAVVITGQGRAFCSGTDLTGSKWAGRPGDPATGEGVPPDGAAKAPLRVYDMKKPVIAALNGVAAGFGASFLSSMDIRIGSTDARVAFIYARRGICNESCSSYFLPRIVGISRAIEWVSTGRMLSADMLSAAGFLSDVVTPAELLPRAYKLAHEIAESTAPAAVAVSRHLMLKNLSADHPRLASAYEARGLTGLMQLSDPKEGSSAFMDKRQPSFKSRPSTDVDFLRHW